ncbi:Toll/interleukin-1 receptor domain-containing protein [Tanacetum coccineum]
MVSTQDSFKYDVFLSFLGEDTPENFVDHLYHALKDKGIYTYKDDEKIQKGEGISDELINAIEDSKFYIIVFSKNYASSSWCLEELVKIMECHKMTGHTAYTVFYDVEPTQVRKQSAAVGEAFAKHENEEAAGKWREALKEAADVAGWELNNTLDGHEAKFINKIVQEISLELRSINIGFDEKLVGMESRVKDIVSALEVGVNDVRMIGIKGMGGVGKTTTARAVFEHLSNDFEAKIFVENVREVSNASMFGLKILQEQVLSNVLNEHITVNGVTHGQNMMKERMHEKKVVLVLDDVDHIDQLDALAGEPNWFKSGSRIIITTRDEQVLVAHRVNLIRDINLLSNEEAICLFSRYAFGREIPSLGYEELARKVVRYAAGLPLTVKVLGSFLCGKDKDEWEDAIDRLKRNPLKETLAKHELSYVSLENEYKEIFLDIACILKGKYKEDVIRILECCGFYARIGLKVLEQRSLITISKDEVLGMHDHIEEMGKNIVRREHPDEPNKHSRLWIDEEIEDILANDMASLYEEHTPLHRSNLSSCDSVLGGPIPPIIHCPPSLYPSQWITLPYGTLSRIRPLTSPHISFLIPP